MAEPKVRFQRNDGNPYPALQNAVMGDIYIERNERGEEGLPMLTVSIHSGISDSELDEKELGKRVNRSTDITLYKKAVKGDLVFNMMRAWQGAVGSAKSTGLVSPAYIVASPNEQIDPTFMDYYVHTRAVINRFNRLSYGALDFRKRLYWDSFVTTEVNIPVIEEQQKIADFLSSVDDVIAASEEEVANLETQKKAVMKKIFSQEVRFEKDDGTNYPNWEEKTLGEVCEPLQYGMNAAACEYDGHNKYIRITDIDDSTHAYIEDNVVSPTGELSDKYLVCKGDILLARTGASTGKTYLYNEKDGRMYFAGFLIRAHVKDGFDDYFIYSQTLTHAYEKWVKLTSQRSGQPGINAEEYSGYMLQIPCLEEQRIIADFLSSFDEAIAVAKKELELWKELKKGLLQQMFV